MRARVASLPLARADVAALLLVAVVTVATPRAARADGGLVRASGAQGGLVVTLFTAPTPLRAGPADVSVLVQDAATRETVLDAQVTVRVSPRHEGALPLTARLDRASATNKLLQAATVSLPIPGPYRIVAEARRGVARAVVAADVTVEPPLPPLLALWPYLALPPAVVGIFLVQQWLRHRSLGTARGRSAAARRGGAS
jgi:hypothetical protein